MRNKKIQALVAICVLVSVAGINPAFAQLSGATTALTDIKTWLQAIIPVGATVAGLGLGLMYLLKMVRWDQINHWFIGLILIGCVSEIVSTIITF